MGVKIEAIAVIPELQRYGITFEMAGGDEVRVCCPFHKDGKEANPSCFVNTQKREFKCQTAGCEQSGDIITLLARFHNSSRAVVTKELSQHYDIEDENVIDPFLVERYHEAIWTCAPLRNELYRRGLTDLEIRLHRIGYDDSTKRLTLPIKNVAGNYVNIRKYLPGAPGPEKMRNTKGFGKVRLHPIKQLQYKKIMLCGGECKAYVAATRLNPYDVGAICATCGEGNLPTELINELKGHEIYVCMDIDEAGRKAAIKHATALYVYGIWCAVVALPLDVEKYPKGDINDYVCQDSERFPSLISLVQEATEYKPEHADDFTEDVSEPVELELATAINAKNSGKRIKLNGIVCAMDTTPYMVPKDIVIKCPKGQDICVLCPIAVKSRDEFTIPSESPALLEFVDSSSDHHLTVIKAAIGIPKSCRVCEFVKLSEYNIEDARIGPKIKITDRTGDRQPVPALCVGDGLALNDAYEFIGKLIAHPKTQQATLLISKYTASENAFSSYTVENAERLSVFWPTEWSVEAIEAKLDEIYSDLEYNATDTWGRRDLHLAIDLAYHSPLLINFDGSDEKGWVDLLIMGDSSNGKSKCTKGLSHHYGLGQIYDCSNSSPAGLLGGMEKFGEKWMVTWGAIPRNDQQLVILEELQNAPEGSVRKLRDMRGTGIAEMTKIGGDKKTPSRVRLIMNSNPESGCQMASYPFGVLAIKELIDQTADIRRFDLAMITTNSDVDQSILGTKRENRIPVEPKYTPELCQELILWGWTRTREQVQFTSETIDTILQESTKLCTQFSEVIPLVDRGSMRYKLARLSAALAVRLFSCSEDLASLIVYPSHVQVIANFLQKKYSAPKFGYLMFSQAQELLSTLVNPEQLRSAIEKMPYARSFCRSMLAQDYVEVQDIMDLCGVPRPEAQELISLFTRKNAIVRHRNYYRKSPQFIELIKEMEADPNVKDLSCPSDNITEKF
jgi:hypothetical protein